MVTGSRTGGNRVMGFDDGARKTIQSIKEIVGNHSDADIYSALKEANMDADEAVQKLIHQDPFHEVKRKKDRKKEDSVFIEPANGKKPLGNVNSDVKVFPKPEHNLRRGGYNRNFFSRNAAPRNAYPRNPAAGSIREFRIVRDNRSNPNVDEESMHSPAKSYGPKISKVMAAVNKKDSTGGLGNHRSSGAEDYSADDRLGQAKIAHIDCPTKKEFSDGKQTVRRVALTSTNSVLGVYSSSTDPVHVPSLVSRSSPVGAIKREVRGGGYGGKPSENVGKDPSAHAGSLSGSSIRKNGSSNTHRLSSPTEKIDQPSQTNAQQSVMPNGWEKNRSVLNRQRGNRGQYARTQQVAGHIKGVSQNKEWKPKTNQKPVGRNPGVIGTPTKSQARSAENSVTLETEAVKLQDKLSHVHINESQNVIIADHIRVPETDRCQLTFGSFVQEFNSSSNSASVFQESCPSEELGESDRSQPVTLLEASTYGLDVKPIDVLDDHVGTSGSDSPISVVASEQQFPEQKEAQRSDNLDEYSGIQLLNRNGPPYTPLEFEQQQDSLELQKFSQAYDNHGDFLYYSPATEENVRGQGLPSPQEALSSHMLNNAPSSTIPTLQQQQMYPQVHVSHFPNMMPYRQFLSPVYVPQMPMPGYSGNPAAYAHPSNGNSYVLMAGGSSNGVKYGIQQYKPVPPGGPTGFGTYNNPNGYPISSSSVVGNTMGFEDSSRMKYKDGNIYIPNPQAETSEIWMQNPRDLSSLQSSPYYNVAAQTPHGAYLSSHTAHPSFNAAAQSSHMQFQGLFHPQQPGAMANPHHMGPGLGGNVVPSPQPSQVGPYQQSQLGHPNWPANF